MFDEGDLALKKIWPVLRKDQSKYASSYKGLYIINKIFSGGAFNFIDIDRRVLLKLVNLDIIKKYHA